MDGIYFSSTFESEPHSKMDGVVGFIVSFIYFLAQAELLGTVIPGFPVIGVAGFTGSTLWLLWILLLGVKFITEKKNTQHFILKPTIKF